MSFRLSEAEYKTVQRAVKDKLAERTGGAADDVCETWCFEQCRSIWLPRRRVLEATNLFAAGSAAAVVSSQEQPPSFAMAGLASAVAVLLGCGSLHALRQAEDEALSLPASVRADRFALHAVALSLPAAVQSAALCCVWKLVIMLFWDERARRPLPAK